MQNECFDQLLFIWQNPVNRLRHIVGRLWYQDEKFYFAYDKEEAEKLIEEGFRLHPAFPNKNIVYQSKELFNAFTSRLPDRKRKDYKGITTRYNLPENCTDYELLKASAGKLATDNYEFAPAITPGKDGTIDIEFFVAGWRYYDGPENIDKIYVGQELNYKLEMENEFDEHAIVITHPDVNILGYVPAYYSKCLSECILKGSPVKIQVTGFDPDAEPGEVLRVSFKSKYCLSAQ